MVGDEVERPKIIDKPDIILNAPLPEGISVVPGEWPEFTSDVLNHYKSIADQNLDKLEQYFNRDDVIALLNFNDVDSLITALQIASLAPKPDEEFYPGGVLEIYVAQYMFSNNTLALDLFEEVNARCKTLEKIASSVVEQFNSLDEDKKREYLSNPKLEDYVPYLLSKIDNPSEEVVNTDPNYVKALGKYNEARKSANKRIEERNMNSLTDEMEDIDPEKRNSAGIEFNNKSKELLPTSTDALNSFMALRLVKDKLLGNDGSDAEDSYFKRNGLNKDDIKFMCDLLSSHPEVYQKYYALKAGILHPDNSRLGYFERTLMIPTIKLSSFQEGVDLITKAIENLRLGTTITLSQLKDFLNNGHVDITTREDKLSLPLTFVNTPGQFPYISSPQSLTIRSSAQLAHETGHLAESLQTSEENIPTVCSTKMAGIREVTSQLFELALYKEVYNQALDVGDNDIQAAALLNIVNLELTSTFRKISFYKFQTEVHAEFRKRNKDKSVEDIANGNYQRLEASEISEIYQRNNRGFMGRVVEELEGSENWWTYNMMFWGNAVSEPFVEIEYAQGMIGAINLGIALEQDILKPEEVRDFISAGSTKTTEDQFRLIGADLKDPSTYLKTLKDISDKLELVDRLVTK